MARWQGRKGRPWARIVRQLKQTSNVCWLCGHPIDLALPATDPWSFTADHVAPRSAGGAASLANVRPAHRRCNSRRGDRADWRPPMRTSRTW